MSDFEKFDIVISASPLYLDPDDEFVNAALLTNKIYSKLSYKRLVYCLCREAANLFYSRLTVRYYSIDINIRKLSDYIILKSQGMGGLTSDLDWLYSIFEPHIIRNMPKQFFIILSKEGSIAIGEFKEIPWHKQERENILKDVGVKVEYDEPIQ